MRELQSGFWHWQARHPEWTEDEPWDPEVSSYALDDGTRLLLFDPLAVPDEIEDLAARRQPVVVLTAPWHERDTQGVVERLHAPVYVAEPDRGSPDVAWLLGDDALEAHLISGATDSRSGSRRLRDGSLGDGAVAGRRTSVSCFLRAATHPSPIHALSRHTRLRA